MRRALRNSGDPVCLPRQYLAHLLLGILTGQKVLRVGYYWPDLFRDAHSYVKRCDACQRYARNDLHMERSLHVSLPLVPFEKWSVDYIGEIHPHSSKGMKHIIVATEYLTKWGRPRP